MSVKVASWNTEGRLGQIAMKGRGTPEHIVQEILRLNADVLFLADAFNRPVDATIDRVLADAGYQWFDVPYEDEGVQAGHRQPSSRFLTKYPVLNHTIERYGDVRTLQSLTVRDPATNESIRFIGVHLDDRSDALRHRQIDALFTDLDQCDDPVVLLGDFNAARNDQLFTGLLHHRMTQALLLMIPVPLIRSLGRRLGGMCSGDIIRRLVARSDLREGDHLHRPTMTFKTLGLLFMPSIPVIQLDYMFISEQLHHSGIIVERDGGSDHRAIHTIVRAGKC